MPLMKGALEKRTEEQTAVFEQVQQNLGSISSDEKADIQTILTAVSESYRDQIAGNGLTSAIRTEIIAKVKQEAEKLRVSTQARQKIVKYVLDNITGLGPIQQFIDDETVTEIIVQRFDNICVEKRIGGKSMMGKVKTCFSSEEQLRMVIDRIVQPLGRQINLSNQKVDARLPDGSRVNATIPPLTPDGATLTIRKFPEEILNGEDYLKFGSLDEKMLYFLNKAVEAHASIIATGGTAAGKTSLLNLLSLAIPRKELIITIEDPCELRLAQPNVRRMEANAEGHITVKDCVRNCLRMRPDKIILGEIRDGTIVDMLSAMSTGHEGSMSTIHADSPKILVNSRLKLLFEMSDTHFSEETQQMLFSQAVDLIVHIEVVGEYKKVTRISEVGEVNSSGHIDLHDIFLFDDKSGTFCATGYVPKRVVDKIRKRKIGFDMEVFDLAEGSDVNGLTE